MKSKYIILALAAMLSVSCNDYLDAEPQSEVSEEAYFNTDTQLAAYTINCYPDLLNHSNAGSNTMLGSDFNTDDKTRNRNEVPLYIVGAGGVQVPSSGGEWNFTKIRRACYFFDTVLPKVEVGAISGTTELINHAIGEMYFFRAYEYFDKYQELGDMPIITSVLDLNEEQLVAASKRSPRSDVARFILSDLDKAIEFLMEVAPDGKKQRLNRAAAYLLKSRVALFEGSWLKNFNGTAFVPNGPGWPGATQYPDYQYAAGSIEAEADWFFQQSMDAAACVADKYNLTPMNENFELQESLDEPKNPYFDMFAEFDLSPYEEVLVWRQYDDGLALKHCGALGGSAGNMKHGVTKGFVESFLMRSGLPIYAADSGYAGDFAHRDVVADRDPRLQLFLKVPGQVNKLYNLDYKTINPIHEVYPPRLFHAAWYYVTGYVLRKYGRPDGEQMDNGFGDTGCPLFRATEAYLNYIEACYEKTGAIDAKASEYWSALRQRAGVTGDYNYTTEYTDMEKEALGDWGAYTAGKLIDPLRYNIRRERRNELMSEGFRMSDLRRWRSMDQLIGNPYIIQGFKLWNSDVSDKYVVNGKSQLVPRGNPGANVSSPEDGDYLCPLRLRANHANFNGYEWTMAHYLTPIAAVHFSLTGGDESVIYQNPGWSILGGEIAKDIN